MNDIHRHLDEACCADLVLGLMSRERQEQALAHAAQCAECESRLRAHAGASVGARVAHQAGARVAPLPVRQLLYAQRGWRGAAIAAAAAAVILVTLLPALDPPAPRMRASEWLADPSEIVRTRTEGSVDPRLAEGLAAYERRDLVRAIVTLREVQVSGGAEQARRLYLGHALLASEQPIEALAWLSSVDLNALPEPWRTQAEHALAAAWRANGLPAPADSLERARLR